MIVGVCVRNPKPETPLEGALPFASLSVCLGMSGATDQHVETTHLLRKVGAAAAAARPRRPAPAPGKEFGVMGGLRDNLSTSESSES